MSRCKDETKAPNQSVQASLITRGNLQLASRNDSVKVS